MPDTPLQKRKILIIEDDPLVRITFKKVLATNGFEVVTAEDGPSGVEAAQREVPSLILCDVNMPVADGFAVLKALRGTPLTSFIPFIFVTGESDKPHVRRGMQLGADDFLAKPCTFDELLGAVNSRLEKHETVMRYFQRKEHALRETLESALPHELRTPLIGILGFSTALLEEGVSMSPQEVHQGIQHIHSSALRLHRLIEKLLFRMELDQVSAGAAPIDPAQDIKSAELIAEEASSLARNVNREADLHLSLEDTTLHLPERHLRSLVSELIDNAFKFSESPSAVQVRSERKNGSWVFSVSNRGRGMTERQIAAIGDNIQFERERFEQQGCGLGLGIVRRIASIHQGRTEIRSVPEKSTTVSFHLPLQPVHAA